MVIFSAMVCMALHGARHGLAAGLGVGRRLARDLLGLAGVVGVLLDVGRHLLHRRGSFLGRRRLLGGARRQLLGAGRHFLAARGHVGRGAERIAHHDPQLLDHALQRNAQRVLVGQRLGLDGQIAPGDGVRHFRGGAQIGRHAVQSVDQVLDLVIAAGGNLLAEIANRNRIGKPDRTAKAAADAERDPQGGGDANEDCHGDGREQHLARIIVYAFGFRLGVFQLLPDIDDQPLDLLVDCTVNLPPSPIEMAVGTGLGHHGAQGHDAVVGGRPFFEALEELIREGPPLRIGQLPESIALFLNGRDRCLDLLIERRDFRVRGGQN